MLDESDLGLANAKLMSELRCGITVVIKDNPNIQTLERTAEAGASSRDEDKGRGHFVWPRCEAVSLQA
jgi:hypothetical protein